MKITEESANAYFNVYLDQAMEHLKDCEAGDAGLSLEWDETVTTGTYDVWVCSCGEEFYSADDISAHQERLTLAGDYNHGGSRVETRAVKETKHHSEDASYEDVITGYKCSVCGTIKE